MQADNKQTQRKHETTKALRCSQTTTLLLHKPGYSYVCLYYCRVFPLIQYQGFQLSAVYRGPKKKLKN
jgi:hypothetical protein